MKSLILIMICLFLYPLPSSGNSRGASLEELFSLSNMAFVDGRYDEAISGYNKMLQKGMVNPDVYFNLGNSYARAGKAGLAILYYEKSLKLKSNVEDVENNLSLVRETVGLPVETVDMRSPWEKLLTKTTFKGSADFTLYLYILAFILLTAMRLSKNEKVTGGMRTAGIILSVLVLLSAAHSAVKLIQQETASFAVVLEEGVALFEAPLEQAAWTESLTEGMKTAVIDDSKNWLKISAPNGAVGWVPKKSVGVI